ncbi:MAG: hypothetical protein WKF73_03100 [Nocardioidaceae bacterium]
MAFDGHFSSTMNWRSPSDLHQKGSTPPPESNNATGEPLTQLIRKIAPFSALVALQYFLTMLAVTRPRTASSGAPSPMLPHAGILR